MRMALPPSAVCAGGVVLHHLVVEARPAGVRRPARAKRAQQLDGAIVWETILSPCMPGLPRPSRIARSMIG